MSKTEEEEPNDIKVILVGEAGTGKTSLITLFFFSNFNLIKRIKKNF